MNSIHTPSSLDITGYPFNEGLNPHAILMIKGFPHNGKRFLLHPRAAIFEYIEV